MQARAAVSADRSIVYMSLASAKIAPDAAMTEEPFGLQPQAPCQHHHRRSVVPSILSSRRLSVIRVERVPVQFTTNERCDLQNSIATRARTSWSERSRCLNEQLQGVTRPRAPDPATDLSACRRVFVCGWPACVASCDQTATRLIETRWKMDWAGFTSSGVVGRRHWPRRPYAGMRSWLVWR